MTIETTLHHVCMCDRCRIRRDVLNGSDAPPGWKLPTIVQGHVSEDRHLCTTCSAHFDKFIAGGPLMLPNVR